MHARMINLSSGPAFKQSILPHTLSSSNLTPVSRSLLRNCCSSFVRRILEYSFSAFACPNARRVRSSFRRSASSRSHCARARRSAHDLGCAQITLSYVLWCVHAPLHLCIVETPHSLYHGCGVSRVRKLACMYQPPCASPPRRIPSLS